MIENKKFSPAKFVANFNKSMEKFVDNKNILGLNKTVLDMNNLKGMELIKNKEQSDLIHIQKDKKTIHPNNSIDLYKRNKKFLKI